MTSTEQAARGGPRRGSPGAVRPGRGWGAQLGDLLLTMASVGGVVCILAVLAALLFKVSLIMFSTGSMAPTIPTGSVSVVRQIPAAEVEIGDVVTVDRPGQLPVTHRVRAVEPGPGDVRVLTLRGDANPQDDAVTYPVSTVRIVLVSVPGLASAIVSLSDPFVLGGITVVMAALVMWAFWPRRRPEDPEDQVADEPVVDEPVLDETVLDETLLDETVVDAPGVGDPDGGGRHRAVRTTGSAAIGLLVVLSGLSGAPDARAAPVERVVQGTVLRLTTIGDDAAMARMQPGTPVTWQVGVSSRSLEPGTVELAMRVSGALASSPGGLQVRMSVCDRRWVSGCCTAGERAVVAPGPAERYVGRSYSFGSMPADQQRWLWVEAWLPAGSTSQGRSATVTVAADGVGDSVATDPGVDLPNTGVAAGLRMALFAGLIATAVGLVLVIATRRHRRET